MSTTALGGPRGATEGDPPREDEWPARRSFHEYAQLGARERFAQRVREPMLRFGFETMRSTLAERIAQRHVETPVLEHMGVAPARDVELLPLGEPNACAMLRLAR
jgi:hypothetical protein